MLLKSVVGYGLAAMVAYIAWIVVSKFINEKLDEVDEKWILAFGEMLFGFLQVGYGGFGYLTM